MWCRKRGRREPWINWMISRLSLWEGEEGFPNLWRDTPVGMGRRTWAIDSSLSPTLVCCYNSTCWVHNSFPGKVTSGLALHVVKKHIDFGLSLETQCCSYIHVLRKKTGDYLFYQFCSDFALFLQAANKLYWYFILGVNALFMSQY